MMSRLKVVKFFCATVLSLFFATSLAATKAANPLTDTVTKSVLSIVVVLISVALWCLLHFGHRIASNNRYRVSQSIRNIFGIKSHKSLVELRILQIALYLVLIFALTILLIEIWETSSSLATVTLESLVSGVKIAGIKLIPVRIVVALIAFSALLLLGRFIATRVVRHQHFEEEENTQVAIATIILYLSFGIALLAGLLLMGVNFTGLAILAGALSVGIGFGLQHIVNNFVSGLILLLEKPIKPGDRIIVGTTEGIVKKIRVRSTQIMTPAKTDVIIPNADLMTNPVTNYMFRDKMWRVACQVGVAYGSDTTLVKETLLEVAAAQPEVIQSPPNQPMVLFRSFGDSSLVFELWCVIKDVNKKFSVTSELHFAIDDAFRQKNICIAFPQRDIHIKTT